MTIWICFIILITIFDWLASLSPFETTKILKNPHKLEKSSKPGLKAWTTCATLTVTNFMSAIFDTWSVLSSLSMPSTSSCLIWASSALDCKAFHYSLLLTITYCYCYCQCCSVVTLIVVIIDLPWPHSSSDFLDFPTDLQAAWVRSQHKIISFLVKTVIIVILMMILTCTSQPFVGGQPAAPSSPPGEGASSEIQHHHGGHHHDYHHHNYRHHYHHCPHRHNHHPD